MTLKTEACRFAFFVSLVCVSLLPLFVDIYVLCLPVTFLSLRFSSQSIVTCDCQHLVSARPISTGEGGPLDGAHPVAGERGWCEWTAMTAGR